MKKTVLIFGLISGVISAALMLAMVPFIYRIGFDKGTVVGYTSIVISLLLVPFGIWTYREDDGEGSITFARAFGVGILITVISCVFYVIAWEIAYYNFLPDFADKYSAYMVGESEGLRRDAAGDRCDASRDEKHEGDVRQPANFRRYWVY
jgi:hypothetical protein